MTERTFLLARNTLLLALGSCGIALPLGILLAVLLFRTNVPGRRTALAVLIAMLFMPLYLQAAAWDAGFGLQGWFSVRLGGLTHPPLEGWRAVIWIHGLAAVPWVVLMLGVGLRLVEPELEEMALLDMSPWQVILRVTLPRAWPALSAAGLWILVTCAAEMTVTDMYRVRTYAEEVYMGFALDGDPEQAALGVLPGMLVVGGAAIAAMLLAIALTPPARIATPRGSCCFELGIWRWPAAAVLALAIILIAGVPLADLCYQAGIVVSLSGETRVRQWSVLKLMRMVGGSPWMFRNELLWTCLIGLSAASLSALVAAPLAWLARRRGLRALPAVLVTAICLAIPGPLVGLGIVQLFNQSDSGWLDWLYSNSLLAPVLAQMVRALPVVILVYWHALASIPPEHLETAEMEGAGPLARFLKIVLPQRWGALCGGWLAAFAVCTGDLAASILAVPPGVPLASIRIFGLAHFGVTDQLAGICLLSAAGFALLAGLTQWVWRDRNG